MKLLVVFFLMGSMAALPSTCATGKRAYISGVGAADKYREYFLAVTAMPESAAQKAWAVKRSHGDLVAETESALHSGEARYAAVLNAMGKLDTNYGLMEKEYAYLSATKSGRGIVARMRDERKALAIKTGLVLKKFDTVKTQRRLLLAKYKKELCLQARLVLEKEVATKKDDAVYVQVRAGQTALILALRHKISYSRFLALNPSIRKNPDRVLANSRARVK